MTTIFKVTTHIAVVLLATSSGVALAAAGDFDPSFNGFGFTRDFIGDTATSSYTVAIHSTGEIVSGGNSFDFTTFAQQLVLFRHLPDGSLDTRFGGTGIVYPPSPPGLALFAGDLAIDNQDRIVLVAGATLADIFVYRFNFDGSPDLSFGGTGSVTIPSGTAVFGIAGLSIQPDNKIVGAGGVINPATNRWEFFAYRLQETGDLDSSFGGTGRIFTPVTPGGGVDRGAGVAIQADGRIVVAGRVKTLVAGSFFDFALVRYTQSGDLDASFGDGGKVVFSILDNDYGRKLVIQPDGRIVIAGSVCIGDGDTYCYLGAARVDDRGALDPSFGGTGKVYTDVGGGLGAGGFAFDVALQPDNQIVVGGMHLLRADRSQENAILIRYRSDGSLDPVFGLNGISETNYGYVQQEADGVRIQSDGRIVVGGFTSRGGDTSPVAAVTARYLASGTLSSPVAGKSLTVSPP